MTRLMVWNVERFGKRTTFTDNQHFNLLRGKLTELLQQDFGASNAKAAVQNLVYEGCNFIAATDGYEPCRITVKKGGLLKQKSSVEWKNLGKAVSGLMQLTLTDRIPDPTVSTPCKDVIPAVHQLVCSKADMMKRGLEISDQTKVATYLEVVVFLFSYVWQQAAGRPFRTSIWPVAKTYLEQVASDDIEELTVEATAAAAVLALNRMVADSKTSNVLKLIKAIQPDILIIIEVIGSDTTEDKDLAPRYQPLVGLGGTDSMTLLQVFRSIEDEQFQNFCMVPPIRLGGSDPGERANDRFSLGDFEGIAVYYNSDKLQFDGPWNWDPARNVTASNDPDFAVGPSASGNYPAAYMPEAPPELPAEQPTDPVKFDNCLPIRKLRDGTWEHQKSGQFQFKDTSQEDPANHTPLTFGNESYRPPLLTDFYERSTGRKIRLLSFHNKAGGNPNGLSDIAKVSEITTDAENTVLLVAGDFNIDAIKKLDDYKCLTQEKQFEILACKALTGPTIKAKDIGGDNMSFSALFCHAWEKPPNGSFPRYFYADAAFDNVLYKGAVQDPRGIVVNEFTGVDWKYASTLGYATKEKCKFLGPANSPTVCSTLYETNLKKANDYQNKICNFPGDAQQFFAHQAMLVFRVSDHFPVAFEF